MAGRQINMIKGLRDFLFHAPYNASNQYRTGRQPFSPGNSQLDSGGHPFLPIPWPNAVPSLLMLASFPGMPQAPGLGIQNNSTSSTPDNGLFIAGIAGKSRG